MAVLAQQRSRSQAGRTRAALQGAPPAATQRRRAHLGAPPIEERLVNRTAAIVALVGLWSGAAAAQPAQFTLEVSPTDGGLDDTYVATVHLEMLGVGGPERYSHPPFPGFQVIDTRRSSTTSMVFDPVHGQEIRSIEIRRYILQPRAPGRYVVGPARVRIGREDYETRQVTVTVRGVGATAPTTAPDVTDPAPLTAGGVDVPGYVPPRRRPGDALFLYAVADERRPVVGQQVTVTWLLFTRAEVISFAPKPPSLDAFWFEKLFEPRRRLRYQTVYLGNVPYLVAVVSQRALFPLEPGRVTVPPFAAEVATMRSFAGQTETVRSNPIELDVQPLPGGAPPGFDPSYVGVFAVDAAVDRSEVEVGEPITLTVTVRGTGAIRRTSPPVIAATGFDVTGPRDDDPSVDVTGGTVRGERTYQYWLRPKRGGDLTIPAIAIPYFDPAAREYRVARSDPIAIHVRASRDQGSAATGTNRDNVIARDIRPIKLGDTVHSRVTAYLYRSRWFWGLAALPPLAFFSVVLADKLRERLRRETPRSRLRKARGRAKARLRVAELHLRGARPAAFYGELTRALYEHIEDRLGEPVQSMTLDQLREHLLRRGFPEPTVQRIEKELRDFDFARFTPALAGPGEMRAALRRVKDLLRDIERVQLEVAR
ncbi:MAG: protein BatD [Deltaproteobacteria bacterium]|nr:MAG: protein BatD [Deltaproteobacteria bacterium]